MSLLLCWSGLKKDVRGGDVRCQCQAVSDFYTSKLILSKAGSGSGLDVFNMDERHMGGTETKEKYCFVVLSLII